MHIGFNFGRNPQRISEIVIGGGEGIQREGEGGGDEEHWLEYYIGMDGGRFGCKSWPWSEQMLAASHGRLPFSIGTNGAAVVPRHRRSIH